MPARSLNAPAATDTLMVPVVLAAGFTTRVDTVALERVKAPATPPLTAIFVASKEASTPSLNVNVNVTGPVAVVAATLSVMVRVGMVVS